MKDFHILSIFRRLAFVLLGLASFSPVAIAGPQADELSRLESAWNSAHLNGDTKGVARLWADYVTIVVPRMDPMTKSVALDFWKRVPVRFHAYESTVLSTTLLGTVAVVIGKVRRARDSSGKTIEDNWYFTKVYAQRSGQWQVVSYHASDVQ